MDNENAYSSITHYEPVIEELPEDNATLLTEQQGRADPKYATAERVFRLLHLFIANDCSRHDIFEHMKDYYKINESDAPKVKASSQRAGRMLLRDIKFLEKMGYEIKKSRIGNTTRYSLVKGSGPDSPFLFNQNELDTLALLHTLFADPTKYTKADPTQPLPEQPPRSPFAEDILSLIEWLVATLPTEQKKHVTAQVRSGLAKRHETQ